MLRDILTLSALILAVLLVRAAFKNRVPKRMIYCLWLVVLLKLCLPGTLFSLPVLPAAELRLCRLCRPRRWFQLRRQFQRRRRPLYSPRLRFKQRRSRNRPQRSRKRSQRHSL